VIPDLKSRNGFATTIPDKVVALCTRFYLAVEADLTDIRDVTFADNTCQDALPLDQSVTADKI
jgi:hypothetical protein